ncbi:MAG: ester cyclase [Pelagimonas sp.]|jgi:predicted ester cyclase|nr:ester cyclase [Pelagimonas sp.]
MPFLPGFDDSWSDAADFVNGTEQRIWKDRRFDQLPLLVEERATLRDGLGVGQGPAALAAQVEGQLTTFPDLQRFGEEMLWAPVGYSGFSAATRVLCRANHEGLGLLGVPTGRQVIWREMSDSLYRGNKLAEQTVIRDSAAILRQTGQSAEEVARRLPHLPEPAPQGAKPGEIRGNDNTWGHTLADLLTRILAGDLSMISRHFDPAAELHYPGHITATGAKGAETFWLGLRAALPGAKFRVTQLIGVEEPLSAPRAAVHWTLSGVHDGWGVFGAPSKAALSVSGVTHAEFGPEGLRREWTLFDHLAVQVQIERVKGNLAQPDTPPETPVDVALAPVTMPEPVA